MAYDYQSALNQNTSPEAIARYLAKQQNFDVDGAVKAGADINDIMVFLSGKAEAPKAPEVVAPVAPEPTNSIASQIVSPDANVKPLFPATGNEGLIGGVAKSAGNVPTSALALGKSLFNIVNHPIDTVKGIFDVVKGAGGEVGKLLLDNTSIGQNILKKANEVRIANGQEGLKQDANGKFTTEGITTPEVEKIEQIGAFLKDRYGSVDAIKKSMIEDPVGVAFDVSSVFTGGEGILAKSANIAKKAGAVKTAETLAKGSQIAKTGAELTNPLTQIPKVIVGAKNKITGAIVPQTVKENVAKVLTNNGKKSLSDVGSTKSLDNATNAFETIRQNAPNIKVKDINGTEKIFEPAKTDFFELPQALKQTKDAVYAEYTNIAKTAGDAGLELGKKDFADLNATLEKYQGKGYTTAFANKAKSLQADLAKFDGKATPEELQNLIEQVNIDVNPLSDKAGSQVATEFSQALRKTLDDKLEKSGNPAYQATRDKYSELKSIEQDVITRYKQAMKKAGAKPDLIDHITSIDVLYGVLTANASHVAVGIGAKILKSTIGQFTDAEVNLRRAFKLLGGEADEVAKTAKTAEATADVATDVAKTVEISPEAKAITKTKEYKKLEEIKSKASKTMFNETNPEVFKVADTYMQENGLGKSKPKPVLKLNEKNSMNIADAYDNLKDNPTDPKVQKAYQALHDETVAQYREMEKAGYKIEPYPDGADPYKTSAEMAKDIRENKHVYYYPTTPESLGASASADHPYLKPTGVIIDGADIPFNDLFRAVHDFFGHSQIGNGFGAIGEENAWMVHSEMFSKNARRAMTTETRGQNSWVNYGSQLRNKFDRVIRKGEDGYIAPPDRKFADQKTGLLPDKYVFPEKYGVSNEPRPIKGALTPPKGRKEGVLQRELKARDKEAGL